MLASQGNNQISLYDIIFNNNVKFNIDFLENAIKLYLEKGMDINEADEDGHTLLHYLFTLYNEVITPLSTYKEIMEFINFIKRMIQLGAKLDIDNKAEMTPLDLASGNETYELLEFHFDT
jgi:ankyrin repeat protein